MFASIFRFSVLTLLLSLQPALAEVQVTIDRNPVQVNESFQLVFSVDESPDPGPDFSSLQQHFLILGSNRSNSISIINGQYQRSVKWTLQLMAKQVGEFMIPAIRFDQERSKPFQVTVMPSSLASVPHDQLVLELLVDKSEIYVQSQAILTLRLLSASNISAYQFGDISIQKLDAVIEPLGEVRDYQTRIADKSYLVLEQQFALFAQQSGRLEIAAVVAEVRLPSRSNFDPFQTGGEIRRVRSRPLSIDIVPIPAHAKAAYWLPANKIELHEEWQSDLDNLVAGEPITRRLTLIADGLTSAQLPEFVLPAIDGIKQYSDQPGLQDKRSNQGITGIRVQKVALIPARAGSYRLPEISLPWWNLHRGQMETATIPARELIVDAAPGVVSTEPTAIIEPAPQSRQATAESNRFWLWLSLLLACGWGMSALYWWMRARQRRPQSPQATDHASLRQARKSLRHACDDNDAARARAALLNWGQALMAPGRVANLDQVSLALGKELGPEIERLNQSLYASTNSQWQGKALWQLCQRLEQRNQQARRDPEAGLAPLNPAG